MRCEEIIRILEKPEKVWKRICLLKVRSIMNEIEDSVLVATFPGKNKEQLNIQSSYDMDKMYTILKRLENYKSNLYEELDKINRWKTKVTMVYHYIKTLSIANQRLILEVYQNKVSTKVLSKKYQLSEKTILKIVRESITYIQIKSDNG